MPETAYNVSFILDHAVVIATVAALDDTSESAVIEAAATLLEEEEGIDVGSAQAEVEEAYV